MSRKEIAENCDITVQAISNWIHHQNNHPSNETSKALLKLALNKNPRKVEEIIQNDIKRYFEELNELGIEISKVGVDLTVQKIKSGSLIQIEYETFSN